MYLRTSIDLDDIACPGPFYMRHELCMDKACTSEVLCAPILLTPISNRVRISSIIHTDGHCGISKVGMMNTSGYVNVLGIGVVLS